MIEITLTTIAAYGSFVAAEQFHFSGVIATVTAGMLCGNYAAPHRHEPVHRVAVRAFWEYLAFALNSVVFLLIGFEVDVEALLAAWQPILVAYLAVHRGPGRGDLTGRRAAAAAARERMPWLLERGAHLGRAARRAVDGARARACRATSRTASC